MYHIVLCELHVYVTTSVCLYICVQFCAIVRITLQLDKRHSASLTRTTLYPLWLDFQNKSLLTNVWIVVNDVRWSVRFRKRSYTGSLEALRSLLILCFLFYLIWLCF